MIGDPKSKATLVGIIRTKETITGSVASKLLLSSVKAGRIDIVRQDLPDYDGPYEATPSGENQVFQMTDRTTRENFTVKPIPYEEISNAAGGLTAVIGTGGG